MAEIRVLTTWRPPTAEEIQAWQPFADEADVAGWRLNVEWMDPWEDPETGEVSPGRLHWFISHEELCSDGRIHAYMLDVPETPPEWPGAWKAELELARVGWVDYLARAGVAA